MKNSIKQNFKFKPKKEQKKIEFNNNIIKEKKNRINQIIKLINKFQ